VRRFQDAYFAQFSKQIMPSQKKALRDIAACSTSQMGGHRYRCEKCDERFWVYHACRNRSCPKCHGQRTRQWLENRQAELLPCDYYHLIATVPEELRHAFLSDQKYMYGLFMKTVARAVVDLAGNRKYLGAIPGILMVLHTWTARMMCHPHVHLLVTGGGVTDDGKQWRTTPGKFLVPVAALSRIVAARMRDTIKKEKPEVFKRLPPDLWRREWCSFCKHYGDGKEAVVNYLSRYVFRIAITNARILKMDDTHVTFQYKDHKADCWRTCRLAGTEFLRRFLMHVLPRGFHKVRYYGLWHHSKRDLQRRAWLLLVLKSSDGSIPRLTIAELADQAECVTKDPFTSDEPPEKDGYRPRCPRCDSDRVIQLDQLQRARSP
jgi:Zn finger protein HypA/HybF involved in hydrogenase expression